MAATKPQSCSRHTLKFSRTATFSYLSYLLLILQMMLIMLASSEELSGGALSTDFTSDHPRAGPGGVPAGFSASSEEVSRLQPEKIALGHGFNNDNSGSENMEQQDFNKLQGNDKRQQADKNELSDAAPSKTHGRAKRYSNFVRVGRGGTFLRIGKAQADGSQVDGMDDDLFEDGYPGSLDKRQMHRFIRIGRGGEDGDGEDESFNRDMRPSSFVRIGKSPSSFVRIGRGAANEPDPYSAEKRAPSSFVRIGKSLDQQDLSQLQNLAQAMKRANSFLRIGKRPSSFVRIGKRPSKFLRIGRSHLGSDDIDDLLEYPLHGLSGTQDSLLDQDAYINFDDNEIPTKRGSSFVRIGKADGAGDDDSDDSQLKRGSSFLRIGKSDQGSAAVDSDKRASTFLRIGKSHLGAGDDTSKRGSSFVRIGKSTDSPADLNVASLCSDKSPTARHPICSLLKNSRSLDSGVTPQKRGFVRIGKGGQDSSSDGESLTDGNQVEDDGPINVATRRSSAFVRIGKIPSSAFVRIGKNGLTREAERPRVSRGGQSSFVRIGK